MSISSDLDARIDSDSISDTSYVSWPRLTKIGLSSVLLVAVLAYVAARGSRASLGTILLNMSAPSVAAAFFLLLAGAMLASLRLQWVARDLGYSLNFRDATSATGLGQLAGSLFFQVFGQLAARGAVLSRRNVPVSGTIIATGYERLLALLVSLCLAIGGAIYLFGHISFDEQHGGVLVIKLALGLCTAGLGGALLSWWRFVRPHLPRFSTSMAVSVVRNLTLSLAVQITTVGAYVVLTKTLAPDLATAKLVAASTLVMLGASVPISLAGWGMREMSAIVALGTIGVNTETSFAIALTVGLLSLFVVGGVTLATIGTHWPAGRASNEKSSLGFDSGAFLDYALPLAAASMIFIQAFLPVDGGLINVNLADPLAIIGGCLFIVHHWRRQWPTWRLPHLEYYVIAATLVILSAFLEGVWQFGWTDWAFTNKMAGWFVLLAYAITGALLVNRAGRDGFILLLRTYAASAVSIVGLCIILLTLSRSGVHFVSDLVSLPLEGFSANRNAFSFQLLLAACAVFAARWPKSELWLGLIFAGMLLSGSRAVFLGLLVVAAGALYLQTMSVRKIAAALALAIALFAVVNYSHYVIGFLCSLLEVGTAGMAGSSGSENIAWRVLFSSSDNVRLESLIGGWNLFVSHPLLGAGLGAFMNQQTHAGDALVIHSTPLWLLGETGLVGFVVFATPVVRIFWIEVAKIGKCETAGIFLILIIAAFGVVSNAHEILYQRAFWILLGAGLALAPRGDGSAEGSLKSGV